MSDLLERISRLSPKRLALLAVDLQARVDLLERQGREPIAIVGMGCRLPGDVDSPEAFWRLLRHGVDAIREVPGDRWPIDDYFDPDPDAPGKMSTRWGGFLSQIDQFDPTLFGISPREAVTMDPQQRLMLEVSWEALEHAGIAADRLNGTAAGVFVGLCNSDYCTIGMQDAAALDGYFASGNSHSVAAGRISYLLGLQGPSLAIDTACSSSLVAVHLAVRSLRQQECRMALAGGVNVICAPLTTITLSKARMMAPDGRCKTFDDRADGFVRAEGCGVVVLKRLSDARADGDRVLAVIRGTAVNQDGRSSGMTAPNGPSQEAVVRAALLDAGLTAADVDYVETHGTGTSLGDPIEIRALASVLGQGRPADRPLLLGSVKTNIGHLESAAGAAGLIKLVLALQHREIPPHLHLQTLNTHLPWHTMPLEIPRVATAWPAEGKTRVGGVSSFGFSGTNAHLLLEEAPAPVGNAAESLVRPRHVFTLSARSGEVLRRSAARYASQLSGDADLDCADVCFTANTGRAQLQHRLALSPESTGQLAAALAAFGRGESTPLVATGVVATGDRPEIAFLFSGQGSQYPGMGRGLYDTQPDFRAALDRVASQFDALLPRPLLPVMFGSDDGAAARLQETQFTQPALFALEYALAEMWKAWGIAPAAVIGHSIGECAAACVAGVWTLEDAVRIVAARGRLMQALPRGGAMTAILAAEGDVAVVVKALGNVASIAAINGPANTVVSGPAAAVDEVARTFERQGVRVERLAVSHAFHSSLMEPMLDEFERVVQSVTAAAPRIAVVSNVSGDVADRETLSHSGYWRAHARGAVRFSDGMRTLAGRSHRIFLEIGPAPVLLGMGRRVVADQGEISWLPSLRRGRSDWEQLGETLRDLAVRGATIDWSGFDRGYGRRRVSLPTYPFERQRYWVETKRGSRDGNRGVRVSHPLLGVRVDAAVPLFEATWSPSTAPVLGDHRLHGTAVVPGPIYLEVAAAAAAQAGLRDVAFRDLVLHAPLVLADAEPRRVQVVISDLATPTPHVLVSSAKAAGDAPPVWTQHASVALVTGQGLEVASFDPEKARGALPEEQSGDAFQDWLLERGIEVGGRYRSIERLWRRDGEALARICFPESFAEAAQFITNPSMLDSGMVLLGAAMPSAATGTASSAYMLTAIDRVDLGDTAAVRGWSHVRLRSSSPSEAIADITVVADTGRLIAQFEGARMKRVDARALGSTGDSVGEWLYDLKWEPAPSVDERQAVPWAEAAAAVADSVREIQSREVVQAYDALLPELERACRSTAAHALRTCGWDIANGAEGDVDGLARQLRIVPRQQRLFRRLLEMLAEDGFLAFDGRRWSVLTVPAPGDGFAELEALAAAYPDYRPQILLTDRCARELAGVLQGASDPLQLLFPGGSFELTEPLYQEAPLARGLNALLARTAAASAGTGGNLRVLEIGAGTGGSTGQIVAAIADRCAEYVFTDLSRVFLKRAAEKFAAYPFMRYELLDIEQDPCAQGIAAGRFDLIVAANVLHATADLTATLTHVMTLLAPGGRVLMLEGVAPERWVDLTFGLTEGWWRFTDAAVRPSYPLLSRPDWMRLLRSVGFEDAGTLLGQPSGPVGLAHQDIIGARKPARVADDARRWILVGGPEALADSFRDAVPATDRCLRAGAAGESIAAALASSQEPTSLVYLGTAAQGRAGAEALTVAQAAIAAAGERPAGLLRVYFVTSGAQQVGEHDDLVPEHATVWGVARVLSLEHPALTGGLIDVVANRSAQVQAAEVLRAIRFSEASGEDQVAVRDGQHFVPRIQKAQQLAPAAPELDATGAYLVTGGRGGLGMKVAGWLVERGAKRIALLGRRPLPPRDTWDSHVAAGDDLARQVLAIRELEANGAMVLLPAGDVADVAAMRALVAELEGTGSKLRGVVHAAADLSASAIAEMTPAAFAAMLRPKVDGTIALDEATAHCDLDFFVSFSSTTSLWGAAGLAHYAAANQFLDAYAPVARRRGRSMVSINWGTWDEMRLASSEARESYAQAGLVPMPSASALDAMGRVIASGAANQIVAAVDWNSLRSIYEARRRRPMFEALATVPAPTPVSSTGGSAVESIADKLRAAPAHSRRDVLVGWLREQVAAVLGSGDANGIDIGLGLFEMGMDSLMTVELKRRIEQGSGRAMPATLTFNYPTVSALATYLMGELGDEGSSDAAVPPVAASAAIAPLPADTELDELSEDDLADLLAARLGKLS